MHALALENFEVLDIVYCTHSTAEVHYQGIQWNTLWEF